MANFKRLLAATDLSAPARHAAERAARVAKEAGASLDIIHVASLAPLERLRRLVAEVPVELEQRMLDAARDALRELAATLRRQYGVEAGVHVTSGPLLAEISGQADAMDAELVILGARGASFMRHLLLGSTAERMVSRTSRPMLVVKQAAHERYQNVLVPVDFSAYSLPMIKNALAIAPGAELILLHAYEVPFEGKLRYAGVDDAMIHHYQAAAREEALQKLQALHDEAGLPPHSVRTMVLHGDPLQHIIQQEQEQDCDVIVMGKHGESMVEELLLGSVTKHVLAESQCDVLVSV
jgi:nucleotide-binding universal stress UspA family protein